MDLNDIDSIDFKNEEKSEIFSTHFYYKKVKLLHKPKKICLVYGEDALTRQIIANWFRRFRDGNFDVKDALRSGLGLL